MNNSEGVIKYHLDFEKCEATTESLIKLNCWRSILFGLGGIGQDDDRYEGYGYGNLSQRSRNDDSQFVISGTQTGQLPEITSNHYVCVESCDISQNHLVARGPLKPSSEALTHAMFYQLNPSIKCVMHVHLPALWLFALKHGYPASGKTVEYGTQEMANEVHRLYQSGTLRQHRTLAMAGHEDGVICFGDSVDEAGMALVSLWVRSEVNLNIS